jgi:hypothetical protein
VYQEQKSHKINKITTFYIWLPDKRKHDQAKVKKNALEIQFYL